MLDHARWHLLQPKDVAILQPPPIQDGAWIEGFGHPPLSLGLPGGIVVVVLPTGDLLQIHDAAARHRRDGGPEDPLIWRQSLLLGSLALPPGTIQVQRPAPAGRGLPPILGPAAADADACVRLVLAALRLALGPDAAARVAAFEALGRVLVAHLGALHAVLRPLDPVPSITPQGCPQGGKRRPLFPRTGRGGPRPPDACALLLDGICRQVVRDRLHQEPLIRSVEQIFVRAPEIEDTAHAKMALLDDAARRFDALGADVRPWLPLPTRSSETDPR